METPRRPTKATPVQFRDPLPDAADVVIVGGGAIGVFAALFLAQAGKRVVICEKGRIAGEQSSRNWGWIRQQGRDEGELPLAIEAVRLWQEIDEQLGGQCGVRESGVAYLADDDAKMARYETWVATAKGYGLHSELLSASDVAESFSGAASQRWVGGVRTPSDCRGEPWQAIPAVARFAREAGVVIREDCAVRKLDIAAGRIAGVITEHGKVACEQVVVAAGAWSRLFLGAHGGSIPQLGVLGTVARTAQLPDFAQASCADDGLAWRRREDGGFTLALTDQHGFHLGPDALSSFKPWLPELRQQIGDLRLSLAAPRGFPDGWATKRRWQGDEESPFERQRVLEPKPLPKAADTMADRFATRFPGIGRPEILDVWAGLIDAMPDVVPIVDWVPRLPGLFVSTGMSGHGFGIAPAFGRALARRLTDQSDEYDLSRFRFARFTDGTPLRHGPSL